MKTLQESLFDQDLEKRDLIDMLFNDSGFKKWINQPNTLWYIYYYWETDEEDWLEDFMTGEWEKYKPMVDILLDIITKSMKRAYGSNKFSWLIFMDDYAYGYGHSMENAFNDEEEYLAAMDNVMYEIRHKSTGDTDGIYKTWFKGGIPKNSTIYYFFEAFDKNVFLCTQPGKLAGGIMLTNSDTVIFLGFPKSIDKRVLNLFNIT